MKIEWNKVTWYSKIFAIVLFVFVFYIGFYLGNEQEKINNENAQIETINSSKVYIENGRQCYTYNHEATKAEPYTVNEFIDITVKGNLINGTKTGSQNGPDMTNGYNGIISGTINKDTINDTFSYIIDGSKGKEEEIYKTKEDLIGIEKMRYPLIEHNGILVPDTTKEYKTMLYARVGCTASN